MLTVAASNMSEVESDTVPTDEFSREEEFVTEDIDVSTKDTVAREDTVD